MLELKDDEIKLKLKKHLTAKGINISDLNLKSYDENSITYEYKDMIIKIMPMDECKFCSVTDYVKNSNYILKPIDETSIKLNSIDLKVLYFPKLFSENITDDDVIEIYCKLRDDGYLWEDLRKENLVYDKNGNLLLSNYNKLIYVNDVPLNLYQTYIEEHIKNYNELNNIYMERKGEKKPKNKILSILKFWSK